MINPTAKTQPELPDRTARDPRWARIVARDGSADGPFWYGVITTGVYCRPSCPSRTAKPSNVNLYDSQAAASAAGFRPCKRCKPDGPSQDAENARIVAAACRTIEQSESPPSLQELAGSADLSVGYFQRLFKAATGLSPKDYASGRRAARLRAELSKGLSVTDAIFDAGFNSNSRFYEKSVDILGMSTKHFRAGGVHEEIRFAVGECSLGAILVASSAKGVASVLIGDDPNTLTQDLQNQFPQASLVGGDAAYEKFIAQVVGFIEAPSLGCHLPLDVRGTAFQQRVWQALREIPPGSTATYAEIARKIGSPKSVRAVAGACAANVIAVAIPCHRVIRSDGALSGYRWGVERKRKLLDREAAAR
jgi:AraC family transcriptional regulator, regulatory protein of adaptative response / methylated-DNA-[protein]-cysteine methyltransferase